MDERCPGCALELPTSFGATDPYGGASAACWALFGEVLARDYGEYRYPDVHGMLVDAYMAQHPGFSSAAGRRSVIVHLVGLHAALARGARGPAERRALLGRVFADTVDPAPLTPVPFLGAVTIRRVRDAHGVGEHAAMAVELARAVWEAWRPHHAVIEAYARRAAG